MWMFTEKEKSDNNVGLRLVLNFGALVQKHTLSDSMTHDDKKLKRIETHMLEAQAELLTYIDELIRDRVTENGYSPEMQKCINDYYKRIGGLNG